MQAQTVSCPNCGYGFEGLRKSTRMFDCPSCGTTLFRSADALAPIGNHGDMHDVPQLISLGDTVETVEGRFTAIGQMRFDYGRGFWDEFWAEDARGHGVWISIDEGDVVLQREVLQGTRPNQSGKRLVRGSRLLLDGLWYTVTEADSAACVAFRGQLPERIELGETHRFINASGDGGSFVSGELWEGGEAWYTGAWLDPFELRVVQGGYA